MDRRRSPPPRGDDYRDAPYSGAGGYRHRSRSPRRSPPPPSKRFRRDDDYERDDRYGGRHDDYRGGSRDHRSHHRDREPMTFRQFMATLPDSITPDAAKDEYDKYLAHFYGGRLQAEFEQRKEDPAVRRQFDPREIGAIVEARNTRVEQAASRVKENGLPATEVADRLPPFAFPEEQEGDNDATEQASIPNPTNVSIACWEEDTVLNDLIVVRRLVRALDLERGVDDNALVGPPILPSAGDAAENGDEDTKKHMGEEEKEEAMKRQEEEEKGNDSSKSPEERLNVLDDMLKYLWVVHAVDYYGSKEFNDPADPSLANVRRTVRPERRPATAEGIAAAAANDEEEGDGEKKNEEEEEQVEAAVAAATKEEEGSKAAPADEATANENATAAAPTTTAAPPQKETDAQRIRRVYNERVVSRWKARIQGGDPLLRLWQKDRIERDLEKWIDDQIIQHDEQKWGNRLSDKKFITREFVVKHIKNKHGEKLAAATNHIIDSIFFENWKVAKEEENRRGGGHGGRGGRGGGGRGRGRGRIGPSAPMMMMGAPIIMPAPGMAPVIMAPMPGMEMMMMGGGGRGMRGRGGRGRGGRFGGPMMGMPGGPGYFDYDAPKNNRAVLDYGDL